MLSYAPLFFLAGAAIVNGAVTTSEPAEATIEPTAASQVAAAAATAVAISPVSHVEGV